MKMLIQAQVQMHLQNLVIFQDKGPRQNIFMEYVIRPHSCQISIYLWLRISLVSFQTFIYVSITND